MVLTSHGCCVFINADALVHDPADSKSLEDTIRQVMGIAFLADQRRLKYPLALIFTKCDLIQLGPVSQLQIEQSLQPLIAVLDNVKANYKRFYSAIPIVSYQGTSTLKAKGAAAPLLWLTSELRKINNLHLHKDLGTGLMQNSSEFMSKASAVEKRPNLDLHSTIYKYIYKYVLPLLLVSISLIGIISAMFLTFSQDKLDTENAFKKQLNILPSVVEKPQDYTNTK